MCEGGRRRTFTQFEFGAAEGRSPQATASLPLPCGPRCTLLPPEERADGGVGYSLTHSLFLYLSLSPYALLRSAPRVYIYIYRGVVIAVRVSSPHFLLVNSSVSLVSLHSCSGSSLAPVSRPLSRSFSPRGSVLALLVAHSFSFLRAAVWSAQLVGIHFRGRCRARRCGGGVVCEGGARVRRRANGVGKRTVGGGGDGFLFSLSLSSAWGASLALFLSPRGVATECVLGGPLGGGRWEVGVSGKRGARGNGASFYGGGDRQALLLPRLYSPGVCSVLSPTSGLSLLPLSLSLFQRISGVILFA